MLNKKSIMKRLMSIYSINTEKIFMEIQLLVSKYNMINEKCWLTEKDVILITYGNSIYDNDRHSLQVLNDFLKKEVGDSISAVHLLPFYPYTSDDGFSVVDYRRVDNHLGTWDDIYTISKRYDLMFDAVINHISKSSSWFKGFLDCDDKYRNYFIRSNPNEDYSSVVRPRELPLLSKFYTREGEKYVWTTFSQDQIDLNYKEPEVLLEILDILLMYVSKGARYIRLDAIGFLWKEPGTKCIHLHKTHEIIKLIREVIESVAKGTVIITETNVPHKENISYFGNGYDEASMVYQFPLPPLTLFSFLTENASKLLEWAASLEATSNRTTYFNFLASHDGIGLRPVEGILTVDEIKLMVDKTLERGGKVSYKNNSDGTKSPYELNINYMDALGYKDDSNDLKAKRFIASQGILLSIIGVPGIYIHSLVGSRNYINGVKESGINRRINREKLQYNQLLNEINNENSIRHMIFEAYKKLLKIRKNKLVFSPNSKQNVLFIDSRLFSIERVDSSLEKKVLVIINVSSESYKINLPYYGTDILSNTIIRANYMITPYEILWIEGGII